MGTRKRKIAIIGAGQAGLQLAIQLLREKKYEVTLFSDRTSEQIRKGRILSSQGMFASALSIEKNLGLSYWDDEAPKNNAVTFSLANSSFHERAIHWQGKVRPFQSIDQRLKIPHWMEIFKNLGGRLVTQCVGIKELETIAEHNELTIVASGKGEISNAFIPDPARTTFNSFQRVLTCLYVKGMDVDSKAPGVHANIIPGCGEYFTIPGLSYHGPCEMMLIEAIPNGPFDCWQGLSSPQEYLEKAKSLLTKFIPWESDRCHSIQIADDQAVLHGRFTPVVRHPVQTLSNHQSVLGLGDAVVLNDPIGGQGANHACKASAYYAGRILEQEMKPFTVTWMQETAELTWNKYGKFATQLSELMLAPPAHVLNVFQAAADDQALANQLAGGFDDPATLTWLFNPKETERMLYAQKKNTYPSLNISLAY